MRTREEFRALREDLGISRDALAAMTGVSRNTIVRYEGGASCSTANQERLNAALDKPKPDNAGKRGLGEEVRRAREDDGLTQEQLGAIVGVSARTIRRWEAGTVGIPHSDYLNLARRLPGLLGQPGATDAAVLPRDVPDWWLRVWREADESKRMAFAVVFGGKAGGQ